MPKPALKLNWLKNTVKIKTIKWISHGKSINYNFTNFNPPTW